MIKTPKRNPSVVIIGAGMTGILLTIKLHEAGITDITILEKKEKIGGTWRENTYPGVACDVPAHLYSYSFEPNPEWSNRYASGDEIQAYFEKVSRKYNVLERVRFNEAVTDAEYSRGKWTVESSVGNTYEADFLISATGILHHPFKPDFDGQESFKGAMFHTAEWDHSVDLKGKRVGIIGTGSTATQIICELPKQADNLTVFQRTPQWIAPTPNREFSETIKQKCRDSRLRIEIAKKVYHTIFEQIFSKALVGNKLSHFILSTACKLNLRLGVKDKELRKKLTPDYKVGCKRLVMSGDFYSAIQRQNVDLITAGIECITESGVRTIDGKDHDLDVLVVATGFDPVAYMRPMTMKGKGGTSIDQTWQKKVRAYRSVLLPEQPNFFLMLGPNTPIGNFSVIEMSEVQVPYVLQLIERWRENEYDEVACTQEAMEGFNQRLKDAMGDTVWTSGCQSWYLDADGDPLSWPFTWKQWKQEMETPDMNDFMTARYPNKVKSKSKSKSTEEALVS
ncbi:MAG: monooxygenase [Cellvibrionaceae bacterium]|nr:monooxygenase [Cellvibrionaceae bacterium]